MNEIPSQRQWHDLIGAANDITWWQMSLRAALIFLFGLLLLRLFGPKAFGKQTPVDIVLAIIMGSNLSRALTGNTPFLPTLAATAVLALLYWLFEHASIRWGWFSRVVKGEPIPLVIGGRLDYKRMRRSGVGEGDLDEAARQSGLSGLAEVSEAHLERSGKITTRGR